MKSTRKLTEDELNQPTEISYGVPVVTLSDGSMIYREILIEKHNERFVVILNKDLLRLGMCTVKTLQRGHKGYLKLKRLAALIDRKLDAECTLTCTVEQE